MQNHLLPHETKDYFSYIISTAKVPPAKGSIYVRVGSKESKDFGPSNEDIIEFIVKFVCEAFEIRPDKIYTTKSRIFVYCMTRNLIAYFAKRYTKLTLQQIARMMWRGEGAPADHATIIHRYRTCQDDIDAKTNLCNFYERYVRLASIFENELGADKTND